MSSFTTSVGGASARHLQSGRDLGMEQVEPLTLEFFGGENYPKEWPHPRTKTMQVVDERNRLMVKVEAGLTGRPPRTFFFRVRKLIIGWIWIFSVLTTFSMGLDLEPKKPTIILTEMDGFWTYFCPLLISRSYCKSTFLIARARSLNYSMIMAIYAITISN